jgi:hypothetical protein
VVAGTTGDGDALASVRSVGVGSDSHSGGGHDSRERSSGLFSLDQRRLSQPLWWRARQVRALLLPLIALKAWNQPATVIAVTTGEGAALASFRSVGVGSASLCGCWHDR